MRWFLVIAFILVSSVLATIVDNVVGYKSEGTSFAKIAHLTFQRSIGGIIFLLTLWAMNVV